MGNTVQNVLADPNFQGLPLNEKDTVLATVDPNYKALPPAERAQALNVIHYGPNGTQFEQERQPGNQPGGGILSNVWDTVKRMATPAAANPYPMQDLDQKQATFQAASAADQARKASGRSLPYRAAAAIATPLTDVQGMEQAADVGNKRAIVGKAVGSALPVAAGSVIGHGQDIIDSAFPPEGRGIENVFRGSVPGKGGSAPDLRDNVIAAKDDLAEIQRKTPIEGKGGIISPDMRLRSFAGNVNDYLSQMYENERAAKVKAFGQAQITVPGDPETMTDTAKWLSRTLPRGQAADVAARLAKDPTSPVTLAEADTLARAVNSEMSKFQKMTPSEQAAARTTSRRIDGLSDLDQSLSQSMGQELNNRGVGDLSDYERRYAALSRIRDSAMSQMNQAEAVRGIRGLNIYMNLRNMIRATQNLDVRPSSGTLIDKGMKQLARSDAGRPAMPPPPQFTPAPTNRQLPAVGQTTTTESNPALGQQAPGGPSTKLPPVEVPPSGGARSTFTSPPSNTNLGVSQATEAPGKLAQVPGRQYRTPDVNVIKGGTATPAPVIAQNQPASTLPQVDTFAGMRGKLQGVIDDPMASAADKVAAKQHMKLLANTTRTLPAEPQVVPHFADLLRQGKITHGEVLRLSRVGVLAPGASAEIFRQARVPRGGLTPPPEPAE